MAKKSTKTVAPEIVEKKATETIEATEVKIDVEKTMESINAVDVELPSNEEAIKELTESIVEAIKPVDEIAKAVTEINNVSVKLNAEITKDPQKAQAFIENEIKKAEEAKSKIEKIINETKVNRMSNMTNWWNGMGYDL